MSEQSPPDVKKHSSLKRAATKLIPTILAVAIASSSDSKAPLITPITPPISQEQGQVETEKLHLNRKLP